MPQIVRLCYVNYRHHPKKHFLASILPGSVYLFDKYSIFLKEKYKMISDTHSLRLWGHKRKMMHIHIYIYIISSVMSAFWLVLTYDLVEDRRIDDIIIKTFSAYFNSLLYKTNRFHVAETPLNSASTSGPSKTTTLNTLFPGAFPHHSCRTTAQVKDVISASKKNS